MRMPAPVRRLAESAAGTQQLREDLSAERENTALLTESLTQLEQQLFDPGWIRQTANAEVEFSVEGLRRMRAICRLMNLKNPLIKRGLSLRVAYVWGQGVEITARANGNDAGEQDVQAVVNNFLTDESNARAFTGSAARARLERTLGTDGEVYVAAFTRPLTGQVQVRVIVADEIAAIIANPEDRSEPWYYLRRWVKETVGADGYPVRETLERYYPSIDYRPATRPRFIGQVAVAWDSPMLQVRVNDPEGWDRGVPDAYAAVDWARAYKEFLEDWARLMRALSRYAWQIKTPGSKANAIRAKIAAPPGMGPGGELNQAGATVTIPPDVALEAISKTGASFDAESGRPLAMMVASALGVPVTMLLSDPGQTGARATAETLDQPTQLEMGLRRELWAGVYRRLLRYVIAESVRSPQGALRGLIKRDSYSGQETLTLAGDTDDTIDVIWPQLEQVTPDILVKAISEAAGTGTVPPELVLRLLLQALGVTDVEAVVDQLMDDQGNFQWPRGPSIGGTGQAAAAAQRAGQDPAAVGDPGSMAPDDVTGGDGGNQPADPGAAPAATGDRGRGGG